MGSLTQSNDLGGAEQMVPLTPAAERARLSGPPAQAPTSPPPRMPPPGPRGGCALKAPPPPAALCASPCLGRWSRYTRTNRPSRKRWEAG